MRQLTSEFVNGAMFAALVVLASAMQRPSEAGNGAVAPPVTGKTQSGSEPGERTGRFAAALGQSSFAGHAVGDTSARTSVLPAQPAVAVREPVASGAAAIGTHAPAAVASKEAAAKPAQSQLDAFVPPIRRQRPTTPPLAFGAPAEKPTAGASGKAKKGPVKRAAGRKDAQEQRSALGAGTQAKVASDGVQPPAGPAQTKSKQ
jgi:hypothetical protein